MFLLNLQKYYIVRIVMHLYLVPIIICTLKKTENRKLFITTKLVSDDKLISSRQTYSISGIEQINNQVK